jgi:anaerobic magnesium-protoporphyrin IX monomethyl ester cyclase
MRKKVVLVYPRHTGGFHVQPWMEIPQGLLHVAAPLLPAGYDVRILDQRFEPNWRSLLHEELKRGLICVGISASTGPQLHHALEVSRVAKAVSNAPVVWGGVHPSILPEQTLQEAEIDIAVEGEGEQTFLELVQALENQGPLSAVKGIWYKQQGRIVHTGIRPFIDLNDLPALPFHLVNPLRYRMKVFGVERLSFSTSRGCPRNCAFCVNSVFNRRKWRAMKPDLVVDRMKEFVKAYGVKGLVITDSNFFVDLERSREILRRMIEEDLNLSLTRIHICFDALSKLGKDDFLLLEKAGCKCLSIGVESGSERIRTLLRKPIDTVKLLEINRNIRQYPIVPLYFFMMGFPGETEEELGQTVSLFQRLVTENPNAAKSINICTPYPGTELFEMAVQRGLRVPHSTEEWARFNYRNLPKNYPWLTKKMRQTIQMLDFCSFFIGAKAYSHPFKKTHPLAVALAKLYAPLARKRVEKSFSLFPLEIKLAKMLGLYARQE